MITISKSFVEDFNRRVWPDLKKSSTLRYGQAFYSAMSLFKTVEYKDWADRLYYADNETAKKMIEEVTDHSC